MSVGRRDSIGRAWPIGRMWLGVVLGLSASVCVPAAELGRPLRPVSTYSIVARDADTGELGVAVQSHWFSVGTVVSWAEAGVGAVATQSFVEPSYGPLGLQLMKAGKSSEEALKSLLATDPHPEVRQVAMVDAEGHVTVHTGESCIAEAGYLVGDGFAVQANMMEKDTVWQSMADAYLAAEGDLAERLLVALEAAQAEGGDIRGKQAAALLVVPAKGQGKPWAERKVDLRVDDHTEPLVELRRLLRVHRAYGFMNEGDERLAAGEIEAALTAYSNASEFQPDNLEIVYWQAVTLAGIDRLDEALPLFEQVFAQDRRWSELTPRLVGAGLLPDDSGLLEKILATLGVSKNDG